MRSAIAAIALLAAGCAGKPPEPIIQTVRVEVPVQVRCQPTISPAPEFPDTDAALASAPDIFRGVALLKAGRLIRNARISELSAALDQCRGGE